jgi:hypothetical protein
MSDIFFQRYDNAGNALGQPVQANMDSGAGRYDASLAALPDGGFVLAWQAQGADGDANGVFGRRFGADGSAIDGHEFQVNQQAQGDQANPALAAFANGGFVAAWTDSQQGLSTIEVRVLAGSAASGGADSGQGSGSGSLVTPQPVPTPAPAVPTQPLPPQLLAGTDGANVFTSFSGSHAIDGGAGLDTVLYQGAHTSFTVKAGAAGVSVSGVDGAVHDTLVNVERLQFSDATVALDVGGAAGQAYRLYQAAFDRAPDPAGLGYWIKALDAGASLDQAAAGFVTSKEFADLYGAGTSDSQFVQALYQNVLHRPAEAAGYDFWIAALGQSHVAREQVLSHFSESGENQVQVIGAIQDGIVFLPWA